MSAIPLPRSAPRRSSAVTQHVTAYFCSTPQPSSLPSEVSTR
ncbi:hypothetical protein ACQGFI_11590 [Rhodococcus sp. 2.95]